MDEVHKTCLVILVMGHWRTDRGQCERCMVSLWCSQQSAAQVRGGSRLEVCYLSVASSPLPGGIAVNPGHRPLNATARVVTKLSVSSFVFAATAGPGHLQRRH